MQDTRLFVVFTLLIVWSSSSPSYESTMHILHIMFFLSVCIFLFHTQTHFFIYSTCSIICLFLLCTACIKSRTPRKFYFHVQVHSKYNSVVCTCDFTFISSVSIWHVIVCFIYILYLAMFSLFLSLRVQPGSKGTAVPFGCCSGEAATREAGVGGAQEAEAGRGAGEGGHILTFVSLLLYSFSVLKPVL